MPMLHGNADEPSSVINPDTAQTDSLFGTEHKSKINVAELDAIKRRNRKSCDSLLIRLCHHHPAYASAALKEMAPKAKDDDDPPLTKIVVSKIIAPPPPPPKEPSVVIPLPVEAEVVGEEHHPTLRAIIDTVAGFYELPPSDIRGECRQLFIMRARHVAMYLCRELTPNSFPKIGRQFGGRDHTTVLYAWCKTSVAIGEARGSTHVNTHYNKKFAEVVRFDARLKDEVDVLKLRLRQALLNNPETPQCNLAPTIPTSTAPSLS